MAHDVFISYSSKDKTVADAVCATLESRKFRCWIAPRDVPAGKPYAASLVNAISESRVFVLILSEGSNKSSHVLREVGEAVDYGIPVIPLRIEEVEPSQEMRYYIKSIHWLDAMDPPLERHLKRLADSVQALLSVGEEDQPPETETVVAAPAQKRKSFSVWAIALIGLAAVIVLGVVGIWVVPMLNTALPSPTSSAVSVVVDPTDIPYPTINIPTQSVVEWFINQVEIDEFRFFISGEDPIASAQRDYSHNFGQANARVIYCELDLNHTRPGENKAFVMQAVYYDPDGDVYGDVVIEPVVEAGRTSSNWVLGYGWDDPGNWDVGTYRVDVYVGKEKIASDSFEIQPEPGTTSGPATTSTKQVVLIPHPDCPQPSITAEDEIIVRVKWGATSPRLAESNADHFAFRFLLDGREFDDIRPYRQPAETYSGLEEYGCGLSQTLSWVHWDVPLGQLPAGTHTVAVEHILNESISDGLDTYPAGSLGLLETSFEVQP